MTWTRVGHLATFALSLTSILTGSRAVGAVCGALAAYWAYRAYRSLRSNEAA